MDGILLNERKFSDFEAYAENMLKWNLELFQIGSGKFEGSLKQVILPNIIIQYIRVNKGLKFKGNAPQDYNNFSIVLKGESAPIWRGKGLNSDTIAVLPENGELEGKTPEGFETLELAVSKSCITKMSRILGLNENDLIIPDKVYHFDKKLLDQLKLLLTHNNLMLNMRSNTPVNINYINYLEFQTVSSLLRLFNLPSDEKIFKQSYTRRNALKIIENINEWKLLELLTVTELCREANVSIRTLEYAFRDKYNLSPKQYLRTMKLNQVHKVLLKSSPEEINISDAANQCGFWHMGQFAKDYKKLFGELPSETLRKCN